MTTLEKWLTAVMVVAAAAGTVLYLMLELQSHNWGAVGWSLIGVVWFVVIRRLVYFWLRNRPRQDEE